MGCFEEYEWAIWSKGRSLGTDPSWRRSCAELVSEMKTRHANHMIKVTLESSQRILQVAYASIDSSDSRA